MTTGIPEVLADPVGAAVALIASIEPGLDPALAEDAVLRVASGRASGASSPRPSSSGRLSLPMAARPRRGSSGTCWSRCVRRVPQ